MMRGAIPHNSWSEPRHSRPLLESTTTGRSTREGRKTLAGHVEVVAIDEPVHGYLGIVLMAVVTTPHTSTV